MKVEYDTDYALHLLTISAAVDWQEWADEHSAKDRQGLADSLDAITQQSALMGDYMRCRAIGADHEKSATAAIKVMNKVRKLLGFTYPAGIAF